MLVRLDKQQKEAVLAWIAEGLKSDEINKRAAKFKPPFDVSPRVITYYRKTRKIDINKLQGSAELEALNMGLALKAERVTKLQALAYKILDDLFQENGLWLDRIKSIGSGANVKEITYLEFKRAEVEAIRGLLNDIAREVGDRGDHIDSEPARSFDDITRAIHERATALPGIIRSHS